MRIDRLGYYTDSTGKQHAIYVHGVSLHNFILIEYADGKLQEVGITAVTLVPLPKWGKNAKHWGIANP